MIGKTAVVTGGTSGIGLATARALADRGADVLLVGRSAERGRAALSSLGTAARRRARFFKADLSAMGEVEAVAGEIANATPSVDVLVNNAGALFSSRRVTRDGLEMTFALNHLSYFLLTRKLLERMAEDGRIVNVASRAHFGASLDFADLQATRGYNGWRAYQRSKLANVYFTYALARRLEGRNVTVNCLHPGFVDSRFGDDSQGVFGLAFSTAKTLLAVRPEEAARAVVDLAASCELAGRSGCYFSHGHQTRSSAASYDREAGERLWTVSSALTGLKP